MKNIKLNFPIVECCQMSIFLERRISKHGDNELIVFRLEFENGECYFFKTFDSLIEFVKTNY
nr:MAG TPA: hypothetical protein [Microviridae sp.]